MGCGVPGPAGPVPAGQLGSAELERRGAPARSSAGRAHIQLPAARLPAREKQGRRPPRPVRRARATPSAPGGGLRESGLRSARPTDHLHPGPRRPRRVPRPGDPGLPRVLCPGPGRGAGGPCSAKGEPRSKSRGRAARRGPLAGFLHCLNSAPPAPTQGHSRPRSRPRLAAARPSVSLTRSTHPASAPRSGLHTRRRRSRLPGFCIRSHARSDTDPVPPPALPSSFPTLLSRRIPYTASALRWVAPHQPPPLFPPNLHLP